MNPRLLQMPANRMDLHLDFGSMRMVRRLAALQCGRTAPGSLHC